MRLWTELVLSHILSNYEMGRLYVGILTSYTTALHCQPKLLLISEPKISIHSRITSFVSFQTNVLNQTQSHLFVIIHNENVNPLIILWHELTYLTEEEVWCLELFTLLLRFHTCT